MLIVKRLVVLLITFYTNTGEENKGIKWCGDSLTHSVSHCVSKWVSLSRILWFTLSHTLSTIFSILYGIYYCTVFINVTSSSVHSYNCFIIRCLVLECKLFYCVKFWEKFHPSVAIFCELLSTSVSYQGLKFMLC